MYGCGIGYVDEVFKRFGCEVKVINYWCDLFFGGYLLEFNLENMKDFLEVIKSEKFDLGFVIDGDVDRFGVVNLDGIYILVNEVIFMFVDYLIKMCGKVLLIVRIVVIIFMFDKIVQKYNMCCIEMFVGFKYIVECLMKEDSLIGGEEFGGFFIKGYVFEKDGILVDFLVVEVVVKF